jgi:hypothetical protein
MRLRPTEEQEGEDYLASGQRWPSVGWSGPENRLQSALSDCDPITIWSRDAV